MVILTVNEGKNHFQYIGLFLKSINIKRHSSILLSKEAENLLSPFFFSFFFLSLNFFLKVKKNKELLREEKVKNTFKGHYN